MGNNLLNYMVTKIDQLFVHISTCLTGKKKVINSEMKKKEQTNMIVGEKKIL